MSNVELNPGTGGAILGTDTVTGTPNVEYQLVKLGYSVSGTTPTQVSITNPLPVSDAGGSLTVDGTVELGATSLAALESLTTITTVTTVGAVTAITNALPTGANTLGAVNLAQYTPSSGRLPIELDAAALAALETITVAAVTAALPAGANVIGALTANQSVNNAQINGVTPLMGNGVTGTGSQRVTIASDNTAFSVNAIPTPQTSGGYSTFHLVSAATTNLTNVKASAGQLFGWYIYNSNAAARKVVFHNNAGAPTAGAGVIFALVIPPGSAANVFTDTGIPFATGIAISTVTDLTDAGTTAVGANDLVINLFYK